jgi:hypothetical protein
MAQGFAAPSGRSGSLPTAWQSGRQTQMRDDMRFVQIEILLQGKALVDIDKLTHALPEGNEVRLFIGAQHLDVPIR